jgi:hypothetical protein
VLCAALWVAAAGVAAAEPAAVSSPAPTVILISLDGTRPADIRPDTLPSLVALAERGVLAERMTPVVPTNTFPNHVSLVTGVRPERHGLVNNRFRDAARGEFRRKDIPEWIDVEPIWSILQGAGIQSASYYWVGSEGPWRSGRGPAHWKLFSSRTRELTKARQILRWLDLPEAAGRPHLITSWFHGADHAGHDHGPGGEPVAKSLRAQEPAIRALIEGLEKRGLFASTTLIFVSDHGMARAEKEVDLGSALSEAGVKARVYGVGGFAGVALEREAAGDPAAAARAVEVAKGLGLDAFVRADAPPGADVANPRFGDVIVRAPIGTAIVHSRLRIQGFHGYPPEAPEMSAIFLAAGRAVPEGVALGTVRSLDVAPTVLTLLGVPVPDWMEGKAIAELTRGLPTVLNSEPAPAGGSSATLSSPSEDPAPGRGEAGR